MNARLQRGYTLIEVMVAFTLLAIGLGLLLALLSGGMREVAGASESTRATLYSESLLDALGADRRLQIGHSQGSFESGRYRWALDVEPFQTPPPAPVAGGMNPVPGQAGPAENVMMHVVLRMQWNGGGSGKTLRVDTLRAYAPAQDVSQ